METIGKPLQQGVFDLDAGSKQLWWSLAVSLLLHLSLFFLSKTGLVPIIPLSNVASEEEETRLMFELVESNPDNIVAVPPDNAVFASDRNTEASDPNPTVDIDENVPHVEGFAETEELPSPTINPMSAPPAQSFLIPKTFNLSELKQQSAAGEEMSEKVAQEEQSSYLQPALPDNRTVSEREVGGLSLSTYAWDYAPYLLRLKQKINMNIHPPPAFTQLGIIDGKNIVQFVITRRGELKSLQLLDSSGAEALARTSTDAINFSKPFDPLPDHFPEDVLIVTGTFYYYVR